MNVDPILFTDLAYVFVAAVFGGSLAWLARQPLILGYVIGGLLISPLTPGPAVTDIHTFELFAEIGVVLLMFSLGIEFSLKDLMGVKWIALVILVMRVIDIAWTVGPPLRLEHDYANPTGSGLHLLDFGMVLAMAGPWLYFFYSNLAGRALVPARDPYFNQAVAHGGH